MTHFNEALESVLPAQDTIALFWLEQSHFVFKTPAREVVHVDPFLSRVVHPEEHVHPEPIVRPEEARGDFVFLTHDHRDHADPATIGPMAKANPAMRIYGPPEACARCRELEIAPARLVELRDGEEANCGAFSVKAVFAHDTSPGNLTTHLGYVFDFGGVRVYHPGDTRARPEEYQDRLGAVRRLRPHVFLAPINEGYNNPGPQGAAWLVEWVEPRLIVPCHFDCFKHNTIDPRQFLEALAPRWRRAVRVLKRGEGISVAA